MPSSLQSSATTILDTSHQQSTSRGKVKSWSTNHIQPVESQLLHLPCTTDTSTFTIMKLVTTSSILVVADKPIKLAKKKEGKTKSTRRKNFQTANSIFVSVSIDALITNRPGNNINRIGTILRIEAIED